MRNITLRQLRYFIAVAESNSVAAAARMVNIAQSAMTKSIHELEDELNAQLFLRTAKGMILTPEGHRFLTGAQKILGSVADAANLVKDSNKQLEGELSIGVSPVVAGYYLSGLVARFRQSCPKVHLRLIEEQPEFLEHLLINGELDVAVMLASMLSDRQALWSESLIRSPSQVWMASNHPLTQREDCTLAEIAENPVLELASDRVSEQMQRIWKRYGLKPKVLLKTTSLEALRSLVGQGAGIAVLPDFLYRPWTLDAEHVERRPVREPIETIDVGLIWRRGANVRSEVAEFISETRDHNRKKLY